MAVKLLDVGVAMPVRREHEVDVTGEVVVQIVTATSGERFIQHAHELEVQRVLPGMQKLMIVNARTAPEERLFTQDVAAFVQGGVAGTVEDAVGMRILRR